MRSGEVRPKWVRRGIAGVALVAILGGCGFTDLGGLSYEQAETELRRLVDEGFAVGANGIIEPPETHISARRCGDPLEIQKSWYYEYHFPLELLGPDPDSFAERVAAYWESEGFELFPDDATEGIYGSYAERKGFALHVFVNRITDMALVSGSGPCLREPG